MLSLVLFCLPMAACAVARTTVPANFSLYGYGGDDAPGLEVFYSDGKHDEYQFEELG